MLIKLAKILFSILIKLHNDNFVASDVAKTIASNYDLMPNNVRNLLFEMVDDSDKSEAIAEVIKNNFDRLPENVLSDLLVKLVDSNYNKFLDVVDWITTTIAYNFDNFPEDIRNLLIVIADNNYAALNVARALIDNFDKLTSNFRGDLLLKLIERNSADWTAGRNILAAELVVECLLSNFNVFTENVRNKLFLLADKSATAKPISKWIRYNFDKLPQNIAIQLLNKVQTNKDTAEYVASAIADYYDKLPENVRALLLTIANRYQKEVAVAISSNFLMIDENARNVLLVKLGS